MQINITFENIKINKLRTFQALDNTFIIQNIEKIVVKNHF